MFIKLIQTTQIWDIKRAAEPSKSDPGVRFAEISANLAEAKSRLDVIPSKEFTKLMNTLDLYTDLKYELKKTYNFKISTNASIKIYEMLEHLDLLPHLQTKVAVFCNAELPGAFISTIQQYMECKYPECKLEWVGSSYYPPTAADPTILDDVYGFYRDNRDKWLMGPELSGDLTNYDVILRLADVALERHHGYNLYTSDAGIDISGDYNKEEESTALLNFGQILCGILTLAPGGAMLTKQFTFNLLFTQSLLHYTSQLFEEYFIFKPMTSRPGNSEVYIIGKGFKAIPEVIDMLKSAFQRCATTPVSEWINSPINSGIMLGGEWRYNLLAAAESIHETQQIAFLNEAVNMYLQSNLSAKMKPYKQQAKQVWLRENKVAICRGSAAK
jgi:23S rRNA U2552 (ribose-2'-O)-methylase RlmE/FtsJ